MILFKNPIYYFFYKYKNGGRLWKEIKKQYSFQRLNKDSIREFQLKKLKSLLIHTYNNVPFYRKKFDKLNITPKDIKSLEDIQKLPIINKTELREAFLKNTICAKNLPKKRFKKDKTSGSTQQPFEFYKDNSSKIEETAARIIQFSTTGFRIGNRRILFRGEPNENQVVNKFYQSMRFISSFGLDNNKIEEIIDIFNHFKPTLIESYPSTLVTISQVLEEKKRKLNIPIIITGGEILTDKKRNLIESRFNSEVFNVYGTAEAMYVAIECKKHKGLHYDSSRYIIETVDKNGQWKRGKEGDLIITSLSNYVMPFIRYKIGDRAVLSNELCDCGINTPLIKEIKGRDVDQLRTMSGKMLDFPFFSTVFDKSTKIIDHFQIIQKRLDLIEIKVVMKKGAKKQEVNKIIMKIQDYVGEDTKVILKLVEKIPLGRTGKRVFIESEIKK